MTKKYTIGLDLKPEPPSYFAERCLAMIHLQLSLALSYEVNTPGSGCQRERLHLFHAFMTVSPLQSTHLKARLYRRYVVFF